VKTLLWQLRKSFNGLWVSEHPKSLAETTETGDKNVLIDDPDFALSCLTQTLLPSGVLPDMKCQALYVPDLKHDPQPEEK
jgi:hypothetical protein